MHPGWTKGMAVLAAALILLSALASKSPAANLGDNVCLTCP